MSNKTNTPTILSPRNLILLFCSCVSFLLFFQGRWALSSHYGFDESCYIEYFHRFLFEPVATCFSRDQMKGASLTWLPIGIFVKLFTHLFHQSFTDWALPVIGLTSFAQWTLSLFVLDKTFCLQAEKNGMEGDWPAFWTVILLFSIPVTFYTFRSNYFSHAAELLLVSLTFYSITAEKFVWTFIWAALVVTTRLNDFLILLPLFAISQTWLPRMALSPQKKRALIFVAALSSLICVFLFFRVAFFTGYNGYFLTHVLKAIQWKGVPLSLFEPRGGLLWRDFVWLFAMGYLTFRLHKISNVGRSIWLWQVGLFALYVSVTVFWGGAEERFLIGSYIAVYWFFLSVWHEVPNGVRKCFKLLVSFSAVWNLWIFAAGISPTLRAWRDKTGDFTSSDLEATVRLLLYPKEVFKGLAGLSPIGFSVFSWFGDRPLFSRYSSFAKYSLTGPALWLLIFATVAILICFFWVSWRLFKLRSTRAGIEQRRGLIWRGLFGSNV